MYPVCLANIALIAASATSTGGLIAIAAKKLYVKATPNTIDLRTQIKGEPK